MFSSFKNSESCFYCKNYHKIIIFQKLSREESFSFFMNRGLDAVRKIQERNSTEFLSKFMRHEMNFSVQVQLLHKNYVNFQFNTQKS